MDDDVVEDNQLPLDGSPPTLDITITSPINAMLAQEALGASDEAIIDRGNAINSIADPVSISKASLAANLVHPTSSASRPLPWQTLPVSTIYSQNGHRPALPIDSLKQSSNPIEPQPQDVPLPVSRTPSVSSVGLELLPNSFNAQEAERIRPVQSNNPPSLREPSSELQRDSSLNFPGAQSIIPPVNLTSPRDRAQCPLRPAITRSNSMPITQKNSQMLPNSLSRRSVDGLNSTYNHARTAENTPGAFTNMLALTPNGYSNLSQSASPMLSVSSLVPSPTPMTISSASPTTGPPRTGSAISLNTLPRQSIIRSSSETSSLFASSVGPLVPSATPPNIGPVLPPMPGANVSTATSSEEWRSWKIGWPWLIFLLLINIALIATIGALDTVSRTQSGFIRQSKPPGFIAQNPGLEKAIWTQGILYTAFPTFIMTVYRTIWSSTITAFAERQPYVDLKKPNGGPPKATIMVDYKAHPSIYGWVMAFRNGHTWLGACMLLSVILGLFIVPLTSFLFTDIPFVSNSTFLVSITSGFEQVVLPDLPDLRPSLDFAAAIHINEANPPSWSDGEYAFPKLTTLAQAGNGNLTVQTTAYSAYAECREIPESEYLIEIVSVIDTTIPGLSVRFSAIDRGCPITTYFHTSRKNYLIKPWATMNCNPSSRWSRLSILSATVRNDSFTNTSMISCIPSYRVTPGVLTLAIGVTRTPLIQSFSAQPSLTNEFRPEAVWRFFEKGIQDLIALNFITGIDSNEFGRHVYEFMRKKNQSSLLDPLTLENAASRLFTTTFAVFASTCCSNH